MDYKTKGASREKLRELSNVFAYMTNTQGKLHKPVVELLDKLSDYMNFVHYRIVEDNLFSKNIPARGYFENTNDYIIEIKEYVYNEACNGNGACRDIIMHEIFHPFMLTLGYLPIYEYTYKDYELRAYESVEWQVKCITGEYMMDYELTKNMTKNEIIKKCGVSSASAAQRMKY